MSIVIWVFHELILLEYTRRAGLVAPRLVSELVSEGASRRQIQITNKSRTFQSAKRKTALTSSLGRFRSCTFFGKSSSGNLSKVLMDPNSNFQLKRYSGSGSQDLKIT